MDDIEDKVDLLSIYIIYFLVSAVEGDEDPDPHPGVSSQLSVHLGPVTAARSPQVARFCVHLTNAGVLLCAAMTVISTLHNIPLLQNFGMSRTIVRRMCD